MMKEKKVILSCSWGKDSLAMLLLELEKPTCGKIDEIIFVDLGAEFQALYNMEKRGRQMLAERYPEIRYTTLRPKRTLIEQMIVAPVHHHDGTVGFGQGWCNTHGCRFGTGMKLSEINKYLRETYPEEEIIHLIGLAADETQRNALEEGKVYPLQLRGITEREALEICYRHGFNYSFSDIQGNERRVYDLIDRCSCFCCGQKNLKELKAMYKYFPEWDLLMGLQTVLGEKYPMKPDLGYSVFDLETRFRAEIEADNSQLKLFDLEDL